MKATFQVSCGSNEMAVVEVDMKDIHQWDERVLPVLKKIEARVGDRARRIMEANKQLKDLYAREPIQANLVHNLVLLCLGQMPQVTTEGLVDGLENSVPVMERAPEAAV